MKDREEVSRDAERAVSESNWKELVLRRRMRKFLCYENKGMRLRIE